MCVMNDELALQLMLTRRPDFDRRRQTIWTPVSAAAKR
jgi:hypothetical protein